MSSRLPAALVAHHRLLSLPRETITSRYDARLAKYFASYGDIETFLIQQGESFRDASMEGATVLDFGCGFGMIAATFGALGAKRVVGVDLDGGMIERGRQLIRDELPPEVGERVELIQGNLLTRPLDARFDVVTAIESLSHVQSVTEALTVIKTAVRPRGRVLVSDGNNALYVPGRRRRRKIWDDWERDVASPIRRSAIRGAFAELPETTVDELVAATVGLSEAETVDAVRLKLERGVAPVPVPARRMVHPRTGYHEERELDPFALMQQFEERGFTARLLPPHSNYPQRWLHHRSLLKRGLRALYPLTVAAFPVFRLMMIDTRSA